MAEIITLRPNELGFAHAICSDCGCREWHIKTDELAGEVVFFSIICVNCGNECFLNLSPVWQKGRQ